MKVWIMIYLITTTWTPGAANYYHEDSGFEYFKSKKECDMQVKSYITYNHNVAYAYCVEGYKQKMKKKCEDQ